jgi:cell division protein FtsB
MANAIHRKTSAEQQLERTEKEMARLKGRLEELRRSFLDLTSGNGKVRRPEAIREFCREINITFNTFTRLLDRPEGLWHRG